MKITKGSLSRSVALALAGIAHTYIPANAAICEHVVQNHWNTGFVASIQITNDGNTPIDGWEVTWSYPDGSRRTSGWNATVTGTGPYTATDVGWNKIIQPGQSIEFGIQGTKGIPNGPAPKAAVTGAVCEAVPCAQVVTTAYNPVTGEEREFPTPCDVPDGWITGSAPDEDGDGINDILDQCPGTLPGTEVDITGCALPLPDDDQDGVPNSIDQCPDTPPGDTVNSVGCSIPPLPDDDNDGVPNSADQCPDTPAGEVVDDKGCTIPPTQGTFRVDPSGNITKNGEVFPVQCGNWFGLEGQHEPPNAANNPGGAPMELYVGNMWWANSGQGTGRTIQQTMTEIKALGINTVRLPIAPQTLDENDPQGIGDVQTGGVLKNHESVRQTNARQAMVDFIKLADENEIQVLVDIHSCSNYVGWRAGRLDAAPPYADKDREGYIYTREDYSCGPAGPGVTVHEYNETIWLDNLREIAGLSEEIGVDNIIGIDIFNEPWDYTWAEWKTLSEKAYEAINEVNQDILIFVEGVSGGTSDGTEVPHGDESSNPNWGENFYEAGTDPLNIPKDRLVLSPHTYGPSVFVQNQFLDPAQAECEELSGDEAGRADCNIVIDPEKLKAGWEEHFGYLRDQGYAMVIGEFGGNMDWPNKARLAEQEMWDHITPGVDEEWQNVFVDYMVENNIQACYWSINPESGDTSGWYGHSYDPQSNPSGWGTWLDIDARKTNLLNKLWGK